MDLTKTLGLSFAGKAKEWTQDYVPINFIKNGVLILEGKNDPSKERYVKVVEIIPVNFAIKTYYEKLQIVSTFAHWLKNAPDSFQIKVVTEKTNINDNIKLSEKALEEEINEDCRIMIEKYIGYLKGIGTQETKEKHYYLIFEFEQQKFQSRATSEDEIIESLNSRAERIRSYFHDMGNEVICFTYSNCDYELANMVYKFYNRNTCNRETFDDRLNRIEQDTMILSDTALAEDLEVEDIKTLLAPKSIDTEESPEYMIIDGMYRAFYYIKSRSYPSYMQTEHGWIAQMLSFTDGFDFDMFFIKADKRQKLLAIRNHLKWAKYNINNTESEQLDYDEKLNNYRGSMYMKDAIKERGEDIYDMSFVATIHAYTKEEFDEKRKELFDAAAELDLEFGECKRFQEEGLYSTGFHNSLSPKIYNLSHRNITTNGVATCYPFTNFSLSDRDGVAIGRHRHNNSLIVYDPFDASKYTNANIAIYGASGHGKTYSLLTLITRLRCLGIQNFVLAPDKQDEFRRVVDAVGGTFIDMANTSTDRINIFDILPIDSKAAEILGGSTYEQKDLVTEKVENLLIWLKYVVKDPVKQSTEILLGNMLFEMYEDFGFVRGNNNSIYVNDNPDNELKTMPIMEDFYAKLKECNDNAEIDSVLTVISRFVEEHGDCKNMNGHTNVNLSNKFIVFGLEHVKKEFLPQTLFLVLEFVWDKCRQDRTKKKMIAIDEGWQLISGDNEQVGEFVQQIFKLIRGFGGGAIFATQSIADLFQSQKNFGNAILSCSHSKIILGMEKKDLDMITEELGITEEEAKTIIMSKQGEALLCAGTTHIPIKIEASAYEHYLFTTKREDMERIVNNRANY